MSHSATAPKITNIKLPNFLVIGAPKCGTTSLYEYLKRHPKIFIPEKKEPHFFSFEGRTCGFDGPGQKHFMQKRITTFESYAKLYEQVGEAEAIGDTSTSYIHIPDAALRIKHYLPDAKIIAILRHPVDRAFSHYLHHYRNGGETLLEFSDAIEAEELRQEKNWGPFWQYKDIGFYHKHLSQYFDLFPTENIKVYLYEDFASNPVNVALDIFNFLGLDSNFYQPEKLKEYNVSFIKKKPRSKLIHSLVHQNNWLKSIALKTVPAQLRSKFRSIITKRNTTYLKNAQKPVLSNSMRQSLTEIYRQDILQLQDLINRDLAHWLVSETHSTSK